jgi:hypothetical protein
LGCGHVEQDEGVVVGGAGGGVVGAKPVSGGAVEGHRLEAEGDGPDGGVAQGLGAVGVSFNFVAFPEPGEVGALEDEFTNESGQVWGVGVGAWAAPRFPDT